MAWNGVIPESETIHVYGGDGSPWTQAVLAWLYVRKQPYTMVSIPTPSMLWGSGCVMPVVSTSRGNISGTYRILSALGCPCEDQAEWEEQLEQLELLFLEYALTRPTSGKSNAHRLETVLGVGFWTSWSFIRDEHPNWLVLILGALLRPLLVFYFFALIHIGRVQAWFKRGYVFREDMFQERLEPFRARLAHMNYFGGDEPNQLDFALFGHMQCMFSGLSEECLPVLHAQENGRLSLWIVRMNRLMQGYGHCYSRRLERPTLLPCKASRPQNRILQFIFWVGAFMLFRNIVLTFKVVAVLLLLRYRTRERSGRRIP